MLAVHLNDMYQMEFVILGFRIQAQERCESGESRRGGEAELVARISGTCRHGDLVLDLATYME